MRSAVADALVFPTARGTVWKDSDWRNRRKRAYKPAAEAVGLTESWPYDLRHSFASLLIYEGASVVEVARQMGNAPSVTLDTYAHVFEERDPSKTRNPAEAIEAARAEFDVREEYAEEEDAGGAEAPKPAPDKEALYQTRTDDPLLTMRCESVAVGCHRLRIGSSEPFSGRTDLPLVATGCARLAP